MIFSATEPLRRISITYAKLLYSMDLRSQPCREATPVLPCFLLPSAAHRLPTGEHDREITVSRIRITKREVDAIRPPQVGELKLWDQELRGFGLRIRAGGTKSYILQYRNTEGRTRRLTIGLCGRLTPDEARSMARQLLAAVDRGEDPVQDVQENRRAPTVAEFADQYMELHARPKKKPRSVEKDEALLRLYLLPALGSRKLVRRGITAADVARLHRDLGAHPVQANRVIALLSKMCSLAELWDVRPRGSNPCRGLRRYAERRHERFLSLSEFSRLGEALARVEAEGKELPSVILADSAPGSHRCPPRRDPDPAMGLRGSRAGRAAAA